jgi:broad specificity phosphatase PhoE
VTTLLLVRHGETDWNAVGRLQGHTDRPLSDYGREQARRLADELAEEEFEAIYASDLARARETAEIVGVQLQLPVVLDPDLREKDWGNWEGLTSTERLGVELVGESTESHQERMLAALGPNCRGASRRPHPRRHARRLDAPRPDRGARLCDAGRRELRTLGVRVG